MKVYIVETPDGEWKEWSSRPFRRGPKVKDGMVRLPPGSGLPYVVDPMRVRREYYWPKKYLGLVKKEMQIHIWRENEPDAVTFFSKEITPGSIGITGDIISQYAKSEHLRRLVSPEKDWMLYLILAVIVAVAAGAIGYSVGLQQGIGK